MNATHRLMPTKLATRLHLTYDLLPRYARMQGLRSLARALDPGAVDIDIYIDERDTYYTYKDLVASDHLNTLPDHHG